ncbi:MAG: succinylglutamate-semialdehyde dehydrogenase [Verrucomicrobia bacterium]|nr:succinylglutamate-semialdehyde dehydrogenase [Verrucomicrobiota bacterium]
MDALAGDGWLEGSGEPFTSTNPATGEVVLRVHPAGRPEVETAFAAAGRAQPAWAELPFSERAETARRFAQRLAAGREKLANLISAEVGKPAWESNQEVDAMTRKVDLSVEAYEKRTGSERKPAGDAVAWVSHAPHGIVAVLGPFNFPGHLPNGHLVPALLAGNAALFKPSEFAPAVGAFMAKVWLEAGLPPGILNVLQGSRPTAELILDQPGLAGVFFTGSAAAGAAIHRRFAGRPEVILALEMGGNNPMVVLGPGLTEAAARTVAISAFISAGQRCTCTRRLIVVGDDVDLSPLCDLARRLQVGLPAQNPFIGPLIHRAAAEQVLHVQSRLRASGGKPLVEMVPAEPGLPFLHPGVIDVSAVAGHPDEEVFGPLLQVIRVPDFDEALAEANRTRFGLAAGLIGGSEADWQKFRRRVRAGVINWNRPTTGASSAAPFGGVGISGNHRPSAYYAADYCAYPVASLMAEAVSAPQFPGLP